MGRHLVRRATLAILGLSAAGLHLSCSPDTPTDPGQTQGQIQVDVATSGTGQPAGFTVFLDGASERTVTPNGSVTYGSLSTGNYEVELVVPGNCTVNGTSTRTVGVQEAATTTVAFSVSCSAVPTGAIGVTTSTAGSPIDPDGYSVSVDGSAGQSIDVNGTRLIPDLGVGDHEVELNGVADNCMVQGANPRTVAVSEGQTTQTEFEVICSATTGLLRVTVSTTGLELDPDGYSVDLDGTASQSVAANGETTFTGVEEGSHTVTLEDLAPNCVVTSANPTSADVTAGETTDVAFTVSCDPTVGDIQVSATTSGAQQDTDGYSVSVDGSPGQSIGINGSTTFTGLGPGPHDVELLDVAGNCVVAGDNPRSVDVTAGSTASTTFDVTCSSTVGGIQVTVTTTGDAIDADGYSIVLDGGAETEVVDPNDTASFTGLAPGSHSLSLQNVADNCTVTSANPVSANVTAGSTTNVGFTVVCEELTGSIQVNMSTSGSNQDPNGYLLSLDGGPGQSVAINGSRTFTDVVIGDHQVQVSGVATNCSVQGANPRNVTVNEDQTTQVNISVECAATTGQIQVTVTTTGDDLDGDGYTVSRDGGVATQPVPINGSTTFTGVPIGSHSLELQNVAGNCSVTSPNPTSTNVTAGATANVSFTVECTRTTGDIRAIANSSGSPPDDDGYEVAVDGGTPQSLAVDGNVLFADLQPGSHTVTISDIAPQCTLTGSASRNVSVSANAVTDVTFVVTCDPLEGDIQVDVTTSGAEQDPDGYDVLLDGGSSQSVGVNGSTTYTNVPTGSHQVSLTDVASNCTVGGTNPRTVTVEDEQTTNVSFSVSCVTTTGTVEVDVSTSGEDLDDGYTITLVGHGSQPVGANGTVTFTSVTPGTRTVTITDLASNCTDDDGDGTEQTSVTAGNTSNVGFDITCAGLTGNLEVTTTTSGSDQDTGYTVVIDGGTPQAIGANTTETFTGVPDGDRSVELTGVAGNCVVDGNNPRTVTVPAGGTGTTTFSVTCAMLIGDLEVTTTTSGSDLDTGYSVVIDAGAPQAIAANATETFAGLADGDHDVALTDVASNCSVGDDNPRIVSVPAGGSTATTFTVTCTLTTGSIHVTTASTGLPSEPDLDGYLVDVDGGTPVPIGIDDNHTFTGVTPGLRTVTLSDIDGSCNVTSANPQTPDVTAGMTATADFTVSCV